MPASKRKAEDAVPSDDALQPASPIGNGELASVEQDEPALSHAAKRKQRKLVSKDALPKSHSEASTAKRQNSVWVGNLAFGTTRGSLREFFKDAGEVTHIRMPMQQKEGKSVNRGFAHVDFDTAEAKTEAIKYSERALDDRRLLIKDGNDFSGRPRADPTAAKASGEFGRSKVAQKVLREQQHPPASTLFLGNLSFVSTAESIRQMFESNEQSRNASRAKTTTNDSEHDGHSDAKIAEEDDKSNVSTSLKKVRIGTFEDSGVCKGWAFLDFISTEHATAALTDRRNHSMDGRQLKVEFASREAAAMGLKHKKSALTHKPRDTKNDGVGKEGTRYETEGHKARPVQRQRSVPNANAQLSRPGQGAVSASRERGSILPVQGKKIKF